jgi:arsenite methyltransferase
VTAIKEVIKTQYGEFARNVMARGGPLCAASDCGQPIAASLYEASQMRALPEPAVRASLGCGNPVLLAKLKPGEIALDLGSGGGIDVLLAARAVGPTGKVYGLDITDDMLALARANQTAAAVDNVEFLKGAMENIPLPANSVDVIISNCVVNLSDNKDRVFAEAFRVLKPGGRFNVLDVVTHGPIAAELRRNLLLWAGCIAGALDDTDYAARLRQVGFVNVEIEPTAICKLDDARDFLEAKGVHTPSLGPRMRGKLLSAFVRAEKPVSA